MKISDLLEGDLLVDPADQDTVLVAHISRGCDLLSISLLGASKLVTTVDLDKESELERLNVIRDGELIWARGCWVQCL
ncbi:hypothetical protein HN588_03450 [Candidatus Bathyarchaeota archaeon]|jgi:hypothetical protein|nr:hypothetical protein [Candidatus Bathyarchaeota archaeon]